MIVFDTETTGLIDNIAAPLRLQPSIIELFALKLDEEWNEVDTFSTLIDPGTKLDEKITQITGLTDEILKGAPRFVQVYPELVDFFLGERIVVAHNLKYDISMLLLELRRIDAETKFPFPPRHICTVEATHHIKGHRMKLHDLYIYLFEEAFEDAHSAEADVRATARCVIELMSRGVI